MKSENSVFLVIQLHLIFLGGVVLCETDLTDDCCTADWGLVIGGKIENSVLIESLISY